MVAKKIESLQHPLVKHWIELRNHRVYREETKRLLVAGKKMIQELPIEVLITLSPSNIPCSQEILVTESILKKITGLQSPDGFAAEVLMPPPQNLLGKKRILVLDQVADPGNLGNLLRTALAMGWEGVILTPGSVDLFNDKTLRSAKGAHFHLPYDRMSPEEILTLGYTLYTADLHGEKIEHLSFQEPFALILSSEGHGPGKWSESISKKITIPMHFGVESLNVAASGAILLYEMRKK